MDSVISPHLKDYSFLPLNLLSNLPHSIKPLVQAPRVWPQAFRPAQSELPSRSALPSSLADLLSLPRLANDPSCHKTFPCAELSPWNPLAIPLSNESQLINRISAYETLERLSPTSPTLCQQIVHCF